jgi:hypothetical protein
MGFFSIYPAPGLSEVDYQCALRSGPAEVSIGRREVSEMLRSVGFRQIEETDLTSEFLETATTWLTVREQHSADIQRAMGCEAFETRQEESRVQIDAIERGLLKRSLFLTR